METMKESPRISRKAWAGLLLFFLAYCLGDVALMMYQPKLMVASLAVLLVAVAFGLWGSWEIEQSGGRLKGPGFVAVGSLIGLAILIMVLQPSVSHCGSPMRRATAANNLKAVALALIQYHEEFGRFPPAVVRAPDGRPLYSWRVLILPYLDQEPMYHEFHLDEPWDSPHNRQFLDHRPGFYGSVENPIARHETFAQVFVGKGTAFESPQGEAATLPHGGPNFPDGLAYTFLVVEGGVPVPWTKPVDLPYSDDAPLPRLGGMFTHDGGWLDWGQAIAGFHAAFADGHVRFIQRGFNERIIRACITRNGFEVPVSDW